METTSNQPDFSSTTAEPLSEPHFDEEATVLSARRVVPLEKVAAKNRLTGPWLFGGAVAAALLLGVLVTATYYSRSLTRRDSRLANSDKISSGVEAGAPDKRGDTVGPRQSTEVASDSATQVRSNGKSTIESPASSSEISKKPVARRVAVITYKSHLSEDRQRTHGQRERRYYSSDDLTRIREIFEGPRKP